MIMVFLAAMASIPLIYKMIIVEEEKDLQEIVKDAINENKKIRLRIK